MKGYVRSVLVKGAFALCACAAFAQSASAQSALGGSIAGNVKDSTGAAVQGVALTLKNLENNSIRTTTTDAAGTYTAADLIPGAYEIVAAKDGFLTAKSRIVLGASVRFRSDLKLETAAASVRNTAVDPDTVLALAKELQAMKARIEQLETELKNKSTSTEASNGSAQPATLLASTGKDSTDLPRFPSRLPNPSAEKILTANAVPLPSPAPAPAPQAAPPAPPAPTFPDALQAPLPAPAVDNDTPFAFGDFTWLNGAPRTKDTILDTKYFTPEVRFDTHYMEDFNQPTDHTIVGATESFRSGEVQLEQISVGGDFHWQNVRGRVLYMGGLFATTTPRNDASFGIGQWDVRGAYKYTSEAWGGYHFNVNHGLNVDAGIFVSYIGLFSYYNFDNWTYQPSYVSSNTPWFFNGVRVQWFPTNKLKIEPWFVNGWQSYEKYNGHPGLGGQLLWQPKEWFKLVANQYGYGQDNLGLPKTERIHTDDSIEVRYYNKPENMGLSKMAFSLTGDAGCQYGGGITCLGKAATRDSFLGWMLYDRMWFRKDTIGLTLGGGDMSNYGRYLTLLPPINGADAVTGSPYFTQLPGQKAHMWDSTVTLQYMPKQYITWWAEAGYRHSDVPYFAGRGGVTPPGFPLGGTNGSPGQFVCMTGASAGTNDLPTAKSTCAAAGSSVWFPDLRRSEAKLSVGVMVKF
jgi:hypothetical protein